MRKGKLWSNHEYINSTCRYLPGAKYFQIGVNWSDFTPLWILNNHIPRPSEPERHPNFPLYLANTASIYTSSIINCRTHCINRAGFY